MKKVKYFLYTILMFLTFTNTIYADGIVVNFSSSVNSNVGGTMTASDYCPIIGGCRTTEGKLKVTLKYRNSSESKSNI